MRTTGTYVTTTTLGEAVQAFVPHALPPADPPLAADSYTATNHRAEMALAQEQEKENSMVSKDTESFEEFECLVDIQQFKDQLNALATNSIDLSYGSPQAIKIVEGKVVQILSLVDEE